ncbi:MAG: DUF1993 family protein [Myxococcota bacterium]
MSMWNASVPQMAKMLRNLDGFLEKAVQYAAERGFDPDNFVGLRLAPDMFPLSGQIQAACDTAKFLAARLAGVDAPHDADDEATMEALRARIRSTLGYLEGFSEAQFEGSATKPVTLRFLLGRISRGADYMNEFALPNFYFHVTTAYAILRSSGVALGKRSFIGEMKLEEA